MVDDFQLINFISQTIALAVRELLETKHLYQSVEIPVRALDDFINGAVEEYGKEIARSEMGVSSGRPEAFAQEFSRQLRNRRNSALNSPWDFDAETNTLASKGTQPTGISEGFPSIMAPSVRVSCGSKNCRGSVQPHNSGYIGAHPEISSYTLSRKQSIVQITGSNNTLISIGRPRN